MYNAKLEQSNKKHKRQHVLVQTKIKRLTELLFHNYYYFKGIYIREYKGMS